ncbi:hypothetical protein EVA_14729 [gut metagenome]|uniref:Uncharacterized protein n=1 Tax=gut metagenome TaxID=749906 RepID=J9GCP5_9ZZZZ
MKIIIYYNFWNRRKRFYKMICQLNFMFSNFIKSYGIYIINTCSET